MRVLELILRPFGQSLMREKRKILCVFCYFWGKKELLRLIQLHIHLSQVALMTVN